MHNVRLVLLESIKKRKGAQIAKLAILVNFLSWERRSVFNVMQAKFRLRRACLHVLHAWQERIKTKWDNKHANAVEREPLVQALEPKSVSNVNLASLTIS